MYLAFKCPVRFQSTLVVTVMEKLEERLRIKCSWNVTWTVSNGFHWCQVQGALSLNRGKPWFYEWFWSVQVTNKKYQPCWEWPVVSLWTL